MAASYWGSVHERRWIQNLKDKSLCYHSRFEEVSSSELRCLRLYLTMSIQTLGHACGFRQRLIATAITLFKRFYFRQTFFNYDPILVIPTVLLIACKLEEWPYLISQLLRRTKAWRPSFPYVDRDIVFCEFDCIQEFEFELVVFLPYRPLKRLSETLNLDTKYTQLAWIIVNDSFLTEVQSFYSPDKIATAALYIAMSFLGASQSSIDILLEIPTSDGALLAVPDITADILDMYDFKSMPTTDSFDMESVLTKIYTLNSSVNAR